MASGKLKGVVISGSGCSSYDQADWIIQMKEWVVVASKYPHLKIVGSCFGHQLFAEALGGGVKA